MIKVALVSLLAVCAQLASASTAPALGQALSPLLTVNADMAFQILKTDRWRETLFVARDGTTTGSLQFKHSFAPWSARIATAKASPARMAELGQALLVGQIGQRRGACTVEAGTGWRGRYEITWFGPRDRTTNLQVTVAFVASDDAELCPAEVADIIEAIERHAQRVLEVSITPRLR
jgi:hypothetical protein